MAKFVEPCREVPRDERTARETEKKHCRRNAVLRKCLVVRLEPPPRRAECRSPVHARDLSREIRAKMSSRPCFKVQLLPRILYAKIAQPRHVRYLASDAPTRTLEEKTYVQFLNLILNRKKLLRRRNETLAWLIRGRIRHNHTSRQICRDASRRALEGLRFRHERYLFHLCPSVITTGLMPP